MKKWKKQLQSLLITRVLILLEYEPGSANQLGYYGYLEQLKQKPIFKIGL